jgi:hypothetical protein
VEDEEYGLILLCVDLFLNVTVARLVFKFSPYSVRIFILLMFAEKFWVKLDIAGLVHTVDIAKASSNREVR